MSPADRRLYDLIREMGTASPMQLCARLGSIDVAGIRATLDRLEEEGWLMSQREHVVDEERRAARGGRPELIYSVRRLPDE